MITQAEGYQTKPFEARNLLIYFAFAFGLTWIAAILLGILDPQMPAGITDPAILIFVFVGLPGAFGPTLAAFLTTAITEGIAGVKDLWKHFWNRNVSLVWLLVILLCYDVLRLCANLIARALDGVAYPIVDAATPLWMLLPIFLQSFILSGIGEEFGWRGYALPRFLAKWNALTSSLILGIIWASWHIPFFFIHNQPLYQRDFWAWVPAILMSSVIYTWIFNNTKGSILSAALFHAAFNSSMVILPTMASLWYYYGLLLIVVILIVAIFGPKNLVRSRPAGTK